MYERVWEDLERDPLPAGLVQRRVRPSIPHDVFLQQEKPSGTRSIGMRLKGPVGQQWRTIRDSRGIQVKVMPETETSARVRIVEKDKRYREVFTALAEDLVSALADDASISALDAISGRLRRWQACLETAGEGLSGDRQTGLFAELTTLVEVFAPAVGADHAVRSWRGPVPALQDFQFGGVAVEVKASRATNPAQVVIASERQLDTTACHALFLLAISVDARQDGIGRTLPEVVRQVRDLASCTDVAAMHLDDLLLEAGYLDMHATRYDTRFTVRSISAYSVAQGFPRLVEADLPPGIGSVQYKLDLDACQTWRIELTSLSATLIKEAEELRP